MHLQPATSTYIQPHNEQDMGFSMPLRGGLKSFPVSYYAEGFQLKILVDFIFTGFKIYKLHPYTKIVNYKLF